MCIALPGYTKAELNSLTLIWLEEVSREKEDYFFPFSILVDPFCVWYLHSKVRLF